MTSKVARLAAGVLEARGELYISLTEQRATELLTEALSEGSTWTPGNQRVAVDNYEPLSPRRRAEGRVSGWKPPDTDLSDDMSAMLERAWRTANSDLAALVTDAWEAPVLRFRVDGFSDRRTLLESHADGCAPIIPIVQRRTWTFAWQWPLRVAIVDGPEALQWEAQIRDISDRYWHLYSVDIVGIDDISSDQMVVAGIQHLENLPPCSTLILVGDDQTNLKELATLTADRRDGILMLSRTTNLGWFGPMVIELSHDYPLDAAVAKVTDDVAVMGDPDMLGLTSVRAHGEWLGEQMQAMADDDRGPVTVRLHVGRGYSSGSQQELLLEEAGRFLRKVAEQGRFDSELGSGSDIASGGEAIAEISNQLGTQDHVRHIDLAMAAAAPGGGPAPAAIPGDSGPVREPGTVDDRRLGVDFYLGSKKLEQAVVADQELNLLVSIGHGATASLAEPIRVDFAGKPMRTLQVRAVVGNTDLVKPLTLLKDPRIPGVVDFPLQVTGTRVSGFVIVYNEDQTEVIQAAHLAASVVTSLDEEATAPPSIKMSIVDAGAIAALSRPHRGTIVSDGASTAASAKDLNLRADSNSVIGEINATVRAIKTAAGNFIANHMPIDETIISTARAGVRLRDALGIARLEPYDEIQVVSFTTNVPLPIEWVYSGEPPDTNASVCTNWSTTATGNSPCPSCDALDATAQRAMACPGRFWGLRKLIEHTHSDQPLGSDFVARVQTSERGMVVSVEGTSLIGASNEVITELGANAGTTDASVLLSSVINAAENFGAAKFVDNWSTWRTSVEDSGPTLLIAMPHHGEVTLGHRRDPALELGGVFESTFTQSHVRKSGSTPGPVILLIGCDTGVQATALTSFASRFRTWSPIVVATVGEIIAAEADFVVTTVLDVLKEATQSGHATMGDVVKDARGRLLKASRLSSLQLILHGDATCRIGV